MALTTAEHMALAVLKGDLLAARALADHLLDITVMDAVHIPPVRKVATTDVGSLRVIAYIKDNVESSGVTQQDIDDLQEALSNWLRGTGSSVLALNGIDRIEVYELPSATKVPVANPIAEGDALIDEAGSVRTPLEYTDPKEYD